MQNLPDLKRWLNKGISENPLMLHGTGIESVLELANTGRLPTGVMGFCEDSPVYEYTEGRLFFVPVTSRFKGKKYETLAKMDKNKCIDDAKFYAECDAFIDFFASELNCKTAETYTLLGYLEVGSIGWMELKKGLKRNGINVSKRKMTSLYKQAKKRKGVIIEPNESILELPHEVGLGDGAAIAVKCPDGLDKKYVKGMELQGEIEKRLMQRFLDGKLEYKGFKTEKPLIY